ncbi:MAG: type II toxin-antitoxin system VapC family toxin [Gemmataceae bacterium]
MRLLIDTHTMIWAMDDPSKLSGPAAIALQDPANDLLLSAATVWELAIKIGSGKLTFSLPYRQWMEHAIADLEITILPVTVDYAERQIALPTHHKDPFDRLIIAQALVEGVPIVCADAIFDAYMVKRLW